MTVKEKIQEYLEYKGISATAAERELSWGVGAFTKAKSITVDRAKEFLLLYNDLSAEWLLRDEGEMLRLDTNKNNISLINVDGDLKTDIEMEREIRRLRASLDLALEKNERLEAELVEYKAKEALSKEQAV